MARIITAGNFLGVTSPTAQASAGALFVRFKPTWNAPALGVVHPIVRFFRGSPVAVLDLYKDTGDDLAVGFYDDADFRIHTSSVGLFASGVWANYLITWDAGTGVTNLYVDNVLAGTVTNALTIPSSWGSLTVGANQSGVETASGDVAEIAEFNAVPDSTARATLQSTGNPACLSGLVHHWKILGNDSPEPDEIGSQDLGLTGSLAQVAHPTVGSCSVDQNVTLPLLAAAGAFYNPTITTGAVNVTLPLLAAAGAFYSPTVALVVPPGIGLTLSDSSVLRMTISDSLAQG